MACYSRSRCNLLPCAFHSLFRKASLSRALTSSSNRNDSSSKVSTSSLLKNLRRQSFAGDKHKIERNEESRAAEELACLETEQNDDALPVREIDLSLKSDQEEISRNDRSKRSESQHLSRSNIDTRHVSDSVLETSEPVLEGRIAPRPRWLGGEYLEKTKTSGDSKNIRQNRVLRELHEEEVKNKLSSVISSDLLHSLRNSSEKSGQDNAKSMLEKSIQAARLRGQKGKTVKQTLMISDHELESVRKQPERKWVERSLEDLEKKVDRSTPSQTKSDPELKRKIKGILSELKVAPKQLGTAKTIVAAVENWGKSSFDQSQKIRDEYIEQTNEIAFDPSEFSLKQGDRLGLFDNVLNEAKAKKVKVFQSNDIFLMESDHLEELNNVNQMGVWQNSFRDDINLSNKLWQYPIDNEVCKTEEHGVSFEDHVFLEYLLDDFPKKGPVRRFMELVINGLQQNPHLTVRQKRERVNWFKDYFENFSEEELNF